MLVGGRAAGFMVGGGCIVQYINTDLGNLLLQRKFNSKTPNIYIANIVNKIRLLWNSSWSLKVPPQTWRVSRLEGCNDYRRRVAVCGLVLVFGGNQIVCRSDRTHCLEWISLHVVKSKQSGQQTLQRSVLLSDLTSELYSLLMFGRVDYH